MASNMTSDRKVWIQFEGGKTKVTVPEDADIDDLKKEAIKNSEYRNSVFPQGVEVIADDGKMVDPGILVTAMKDYGTSVKPFCLQIKRGKHGLQNELQMETALLQKVVDAFGRLSLKHDDKKATSVFESMGLEGESTLPAVKYHSCQIQKSSQGLSMLPRNRTANLPSNSVPMTAISHMVTGLVIPQTRHYKYSLCDLLQKLDCYQHCKIDGLSSQQQCYFLLAHYIQTFEQVALTLGGSFKKLRNLCSLCIEGRDSLIDVAVYNIGCVDTKVRNRVSESTCSSIEVHDSCLACQRIKSLIKHSEGKNVFEANTTCENGMLNLVVEHHSKGLTKKDEESFESTLNQAVYLGVDILRLMLTVRDVRTCTVYYFPSNDVLFGVVAIKLSFVVQLLQFQCTFEEISADKVENHIKSTIQCHQKNYLSVFKDLEHNGNNVRYNTAVWLEHDAIKEEILIVFRAHYFFHDWTSIKMTQYQSSSSFIFLLSSENGMHVFAKCPIYPRVNHTNIHSDLKNRMKTLSKTKQSTLMHSPVYNLLETVKFGGDKFFYLYPRLHGPLSREEAKKYLADFFCYTVDTLKLLHSLKYYHCDVRLENICFSIDNPFRAVLIDIDHFYDSEEKDWQKDFSDLSKKSCLYSADPSFDPNKTDWRQLGCTLVWILCPGSALTIHELELESFSDRLCKVENLTLTAATFWGVIITSLIQGNEPSIEHLSLVQKEKASGCILESYFCANS